MSLKTLRVRVDHLLIGVGVVAAVVGSVVAWRALRPPPAQAELDEGLDRLRSKAGPSGDSAGGDKPRFIRPRGAFASDDHEPQRVGWAEPQTPQRRDPNDLDPVEAVDEFKTAMAELEAAVEAGGRLSKREQGELYNRATGSFTALSAWVDANDPTERQLMEDAYAEMMRLMRQLDLDPPNHHPEGHPDGALIRR